MDADLQDDPAMIPNFLAAIDSGYDLVSGWKVHRHDPPTKTLPSRLFNMVTAKATGVKLHDFNCGFKAYRRELVDKLSIYGELHRFIPALAHWKGFEVVEIPVEHHPRMHGKSKFGARRFLSGLLDLATVLFLTRFNRKPLHLFGSVGLISVFAGLLINAYLTVLRLQGETIGNRPLLLLGVLLMIIGLQFFGIGLLADLSNLSSTRPSDLDHYYEVWPLPAPAAKKRVTRTKRPVRSTSEHSLS
jgi:glycosyltransferase involved in cell wall biosynthesis